MLNFSLSQAGAQMVLDALTDSALSARKEARRVERFGDMERERLIDENDKLRSDVAAALGLHRAGSVNFIPIETACGGPRNGMNGDAAAVMEALATGRYAESCRPVSQAMRETLPENHPLWAGYTPVGATGCDRAGCHNRPVGAAAE